MHGDLSEDELSLGEVCKFDSESFPEPSAEPLNKARKRSSLKMGGRTAEPPWYGKARGKAHEASSGKSRDRTASVDLLDRKTGCEYPSLETKLELRTSLGFEPPSRDMVEVGLKGARWMES